MTEAMMYPTHTTSTTGTFRVPSAAATPPPAPQAPAVRGTGNLYPTPPHPLRVPTALTDPLPDMAQAAPTAGLPAADPVLPDPVLPDPVLPDPGQAARVAAAAADLPAHPAGAGAEPPAETSRPVAPLPHAAQAAPAAGPLSYAAQTGPGAGSSGVVAGVADPGRRGWVAGTPARLVAAPREVALPHGRPAAEAARSEVPAARNRAEAEPVPALAGAVDRAESGGGSYGHEPDPLVCVPAPAGPGPDEAAHTGVATLRLRGFDGGGEPAPPLGQVWPPAGPEADAGTESATDRPAQRYGEAWPPAGPQAEPDPEAAAHVRAPAYGVAVGPEAEPEAGPEPAHLHGQIGPQAGSDSAHPHGRAGLQADPESAHAYGQVGLRAAESAHGHAHTLGHAQGHGTAGPGGPYGPAEPAVAVPVAVPGPAVADIVAQAVARGMGAERQESDPQDLPRTAPARGAAVTEVPVHLPFPGESRPAQAQAQAQSQARLPAPAAAPRSRAARPAPSRRVPRGDDRLREHRGPVLPGWVGVGVGGLALAGCLAVLWRAGAVPATLVAAFGATPRAYEGLRATHWPPLAFLGIVALLALGGLGRAKAGHAWVLTLFGRYRGTVRRTGLTWVSPLLLRQRVDVRLRHWRSEPMPAVDSGGLALRVVVQVVWQVKDTARATLAVEDHTDYLAEQVESAMARVLSQLPADAFHEDAPTLRDAEAVGDALTRMLATETEAVGIEVYSAQPTRIEYAPDVAEAMRRRRVAAIDAKHRDTVLTSIVDAVDDTVHRLTSRGLVELDDYERKALVKDLTVAFYTGRPE
ncbi:SPFH domain-containing protein [Streptomyces sp. A1547]|uniref:SPFH domain-containing protein n=1 Tax=Streptomyces sp. A1547 TaxID=2563105 RepID=UPI001F103E41|nr:SPFH domain-containing protein [Streptomyces sp. A1547]